jgi:hypothetical protein
MAPPRVWRGAQYVNDNGKDPLVINNPKMNPPIKKERIIDRETAKILLILKVTLCSTTNNNRSKINAAIAKPTTKNKLEFRKRTIRVLIMPTPVAAPNLPTIQTDSMMGKKTIRS